MTIGLFFLGTCIKTVVIYPMIILGSSCLLTEVNFIFIHIIFDIVNVYPTEVTVAHSFTHTAITINCAQKICPFLYLNCHHFSLYYISVLFISGGLIFLAIIGGTIYDVIKL